MHQKLIRNIWAVGRNYADHAAEMKAAVPKSPMIFLKAGTSIETSSKIKLPSWSNEIHYELELAFWVDEKLSYSHITLALDLTARDAQNEAKAKSAPWTLAKSFQGACPLGSWLSLSEIQNLDDLTFTLHVNDQIRQSGRVQDMIFNPATLLTYVQSHFPLTPSDVILTGTPAGVGPLQSGDTLVATLQIQNHTLLTCLWDVE
jgi:2-keto-4-pentenoate hydratase/2-oxohepta-3-ene-1,7-dioic acid hydratase in catechol pathway